MKKLGFVLTMVAFMLLCGMTAIAAPKFDKTNVAKGYITITYDGEVVKKLVKLKVEVEGNKDYYSYTIITNEPFNVPLSFGDGKYKFTIMERVSGTKYKGIAVDSFTAKITSDLDRYLVSSPIVDYNKDTKAVVDYQKKFTDGKLTTPATKVNLFYEEMVKGFKYDFDKMNDVINKKYPDGYTPIIDTVYVAKKGICYDYSSVTAGVLRAAGVPTKVVVGYAPEVDSLHAWNEIYLDGKWIVADLTYDAAYAQAGQKYSMAKDAKLFKPTKIY